MAPSLSHFPTLCLEAIFKHVPLVDLIDSLGFVCRSFHAVQQTELRRRRRVVLMGDDYALMNQYASWLFTPHSIGLIGRIRREDGSPWARLEPLEQIEFDALPLGNWAAVAPIMWMHLSYITELIVIFHDHHSSLRGVVLLIDHCSDQLVDLKLHIDANAEFTNDDHQFGLDVQSLFDSLNRARSLRHLRLHLEESPELHIRYRLPFLSRLDTCAIKIFRVSENVERWLLPELARHHNGRGTIELYSLMQMPQSLQLINPKLDGHFRAMSLEFDRTAQVDTIGNDLRLVGTRFSSLTKLSLVLNLCKSIQMPVLARHLSQLSQLFWLNLEQTDGRGAQQEQVVEQQVEHVPEQQIAQLPSVRLLILSIATQSHRDTDQLYIAPIFPNLQAIHFNQSVRECPECGITYGYYNNPFEPDVAECMRLSRRLFWDCTTLHTIQLYDSDTMIENEL